MVELKDILLNCLITGWLTGNGFSDEEAIEALDTKLNYLTSNQGYRARLYPDGAVAY